MKLHHLVAAVVVMFTISPTISTRAQTSASPNEGLIISADSPVDGVPGYDVLWWGHAGRHYLLQHSDDLIHWTYLPIIEPGANQAIGWGFATGEPNFFFRLRYGVSPAISTGFAHSFLVNADGTVSAWGANSQGELGNGTTVMTANAGLVQGLANVGAVAAGGDHSLALKNDRSVWAWGSNGWGQLGDGTTEERNLAQQVPAFPGGNGGGAVQVAAGNGFSVVLGDYGVVWTWGENQYGQLGDGTTTNRPLPVQVNLAYVDLIAAGGTFALATTSDGVVWSWGGNWHGQLGNNSTINSATPVPVQLTDSSGVKAIAAGDQFGLALCSDGLVYAWGENQDGQLGNNSTATSLLPVQVQIPDTSGVVAIAAGDSFGLALCADGALYAWGANDFGELGNGAGANRSVPVQVHIPDASGIADVSGGGTFGMALCNDGRVYGWGGNQNGELGAYTAPNSGIPAQAVNLTLRAQWQFENASSLGDDSSGNSNVMTVTNGVQTPQAFDGNGALLFSVPAIDGSGAPVASGASAVNTAGELLPSQAGEPFTVALWFYAEGFSTGDKCTLVANDAAGGSGFQCVLNDNSGSPTLQFSSLPPDGGTVNLSINLPIDSSNFASRWHHLVIGYDGEAASLYLDGVLAGSENGIILPSPQPVVLAGQSAVASQMPSFEMLFDDAFVFAAPPTQALVSALFNADNDGNGLPDWWELENFGQKGLNAGANAPNGSGLTLLQCYQQGVSPQQAAAAEPLSIAVNVTGPFQAPANPVIVPEITHPSGVTITRVEYYDVTTGASQLLSSLSNAPYQFQMNIPDTGGLPSASFTIEAIAYASDGTSASAMTQFTVTQYPVYVRGANLNVVFDSQIIAADLQRGQGLDGMQGPDASNNYANLYLTSQYPWFLRTQSEANELWQHIETINNSVPSYATFQVAPKINGVTVGGAPPLAAFGSQGGGTALYTNYGYRFGVAPGGQVVFAPITISSVVNSTGILTTASAHGLHVGQLIVISGAKGDTALNGTFVVNSTPAGHPRELTLATPLGGAVHLSGAYTASSATIRNADIKVEAYAASTFANQASQVAPVYVQAFTVPRESDAAAWSAFVSSGFVQDNHIVQTVGSSTIDLDTQVQLVPGQTSDDTWGQQVNYALLVRHSAANADFYFKVSYMGVTAPDDGTTSLVASSSSDVPMAIDSAGEQTYNLNYTLDFTVPSPWQSTYVNQPQFQSTPMPDAYAGESVDELIHDAPPVTDTLAAPGAGGLFPVSGFGNLDLVHVNTSPELRQHSVLDQFVSSMKGDPMALTNYVLNQIALTDAVGYDTQTGQISDTSINPQGVSRDALAVYLEGQGSPVEQDALLIYLLRAAGYPCAYVFPQQDQTLLFDEQLSNLLRMKIRGAVNPVSGNNVPELIPVNYPWVAAYINGQWVHLFPWLKDTSVTEGADLWSYLPSGYQTGGQWLQHYLMNDPSIRQLKTPDGLYTDDVNVLFPLYVQNQLAGTGLTLDQLGMSIYDRQNYYTRWEDFPRPWQTPTIGASNLAMNLDTNQNPSALSGALTNIFDEISVTVTSDRNGNGATDPGEPVISTGNLRLCDLHDRRLLLYHQVTSAPGSPAPTYNLILSLEPFSSTATSGPYTFNSNASYNGSSHPDPGDLLNRQMASTPLQTTSDSNNDDAILFQINYNRHRQAQALGATKHWTSFLGLTEVDTISDTRHLRKGDMACLCLDYGQTSPKMLEFQAEKYWNYQQTVAANPGAPIDPELAEGQLLFLMGSTYYNKVSGLIKNAEAWTKTQSISVVAHGLSKLSPVRNSDGSPNLINNDVNLRYPRVDMSFQQVAAVGNSTVDLDSPDEGNLAAYGCDQLIVGGGSAYEHLTINQFFQQAAAISTVKLLDIAQGWTPSTQVAANPGQNVVTLTLSNYITAGAVVYPGNSGNGTHQHTLQYWCSNQSSSQNPPSGSLWAGFISTFSDPNAGPLSTIYVTPGPITAPGQGGQAYTGIGAMSLSPGFYGAYITDNMVIDNGGYGGDIGYSIQESDPPPAFVTDSVLTQAPDGGYIFLNTGIAVSTAPLYAPTTVAPSNFGTVETGLANSSQIFTADLAGALNAWNAQVTVGTVTTLGNTGVATAAAATSMANGGDMGPVASNGNMQSSSSSIFAGLGKAIGDPVNVVTGEFYVNALDLRLNGPMPLEIRRTYGSLNQADNNFGHGWRVSYFPYLMLSSDTVYNAQNTQVVSPPTLIYAAEMDGSVIAYRTTDGSHWTPLAADNPNLTNSSNGMVGGPANLFNNRIDQSTVQLNGTTCTAYLLTGADGSVRTFAVEAFSTGGSTILSRTRPYLQKWTDNRGNYYTFSYGMVSTSTDYGQLNGIQSSNGDYAGFVYDTYGHIIQAYSGDGRFLSYQYDGYGDLIQVTLPDASSVQYAYQHATAPAVSGAAVNGNGTYIANSASVTSDNGLVITAATNASPTVLTTASAHGLQVGQTVVIAGASGNTAINGAFTVGSVPSSTKLTLLSGATPATVYSTHLIIQETKPGGRILQNTYDPTNSYAKRQVLTQSATVGANGAVTQNASFDYGTPTQNADGITFDGRTITTDVFGNTTTYHYLGNQISEVDYPAQNTTNLNQKSNGPKETQAWYTTTGGGGFHRSLQYRIDKRGLRTDYTYDGSGNLLTLKLTGNLTGGTSNSETATTTMTYNSSVAVSLPGGGTAIPNTLASVTRQIDDPANGNNIGRTLATTFLYGDSAHPYEPTLITSATGATVLSATRNQYQDISGSGALAYGMLVRRSEASGTVDEAVCQYAYNSNGFPISKTEYTGTADPNVTKTFAYNLRGEMITETDAAGQSTQFSYDAMSRPTGQKRFDAWGNLVSAGFVYYNRNGEAEWVQGPRYSPNDYVYKQFDAAGRQSQEVKWLSAALPDGSGVTANGYATTLYSHDAFGNLTEIDDPNQTASLMNYDAQGEMLGCNIYGNGTGFVGGDSFTYEPGGAMSTHVDRLGGVDTRNYTSVGLLMNETTPDGATAARRYDLSGRVSREILRNGNYWATTYDDANRLVTRVFYDGGFALMQENQSFDRRGNVIARTDVAGNTFTTSYDCLNRPKASTGPPNSGNTAQQATFRVYDAAGQFYSVNNLAGERTDSYFDALGRPTLVSVFNSDGTAAKNTGYWYAPDHQSVVTTAGTGASAVTTRHYTDTRGNVVLLQHADGSWQSTSYDANGNKVSFIGENVQGYAQQTTWTYDALNRVTRETLPADPGQTPAETMFNYALNGLGETVVRTMPENLSLVTVYDLAGRKQTEKLEGAGGAVTRSCAYSYYVSGDPHAGLLENIALQPDAANPGGGFLSTVMYDGLLRTQTVTSSGSNTNEQNQISTYTYDNRGMVSGIVQAYQQAATGPSTFVARSFDAYGQISEESVALNPSGAPTFNGTQPLISSWTQSWDAAGRRSSLNSLLPAQGVGAGRQYGFQYNANGQLASVANGGITYNYGYGDNGLLEARTAPLRTQTITSRDNRGRVLTQNTAAAGVTQLSETLTWRADDRIDTYSVNGPVVSTESRAYGYNGRGQLVSEPYYNRSNDSGGTPYLPDGAQTAIYYFDQTGLPSGAPGVEGGLGVRTLQYVNSSSADQAGAQDAFSRVTQVSDYDGAGNYLPWALGHDPAGNVSTRTVSAGGTTYNAQTLVWDSFNRLVRVSQRDTGSSDFDSTTVYDGLGRRIQTTWQPMNNGAASGSPSVLNYYYDPQVEFLELGLNNNGVRKWKVYGPDRSGSYGGAQGEGGLENEIDEMQGFVDTPINDFFGNAVGEAFAPSIVNPGYTLTYGYGLSLGSYGPEPGSGVSSLTPEWRGHYADWTGFFCIGARYYEARSGRFLSADPLGHAASMGLYDYCHGDPVNGCDPDGRIGRALTNGETGDGLGNLPDTPMNRIASVIGGGLAGLDDWQMLFADKISLGSDPGIHAYASSLQGSGWTWSNGLLNTGLAAGAVASGGAVLASDAATLAAGRALQWTIANPLTSTLVTGGTVAALDTFDQTHSVGASAVNFVVGAGLNVAANPMALLPASTTGGAAAATARPIQVTAETISDALEGSTMQTTQGQVSLPAVQRYVQMLEGGAIPPPITVDGNVIVDGNHRYIAGRVFGVEPATVPGTLSPSQVSQVVPIQKTIVDPADWGNH